MFDEIRNKLIEYLSSRKTLDDFQAWFIPEIWDIEREDDPELHNLVYSIELRLAEYSSGHLSEEELRQELIPFVVNQRVKLSFGAQQPEITPQTLTGSQHLQFEQPISI